MKAICPNCGAVHEDGSEFCSVCSTKLEPENNKKIKKEKKNKGKKSGKKFIIIGGILVLFILLIVLIVKGCSKDGGNNTDGIDKNNPINKTVMIYVVGSDLESEGKNATVDLSEISRSGVNTETNNILVCTGGASKWHNKYVTADENAILKLTGNDFEKLESYPVKSMGESSTLSDFITYGISNFPNEQYVLILWNHGGGPMLGYGIDEINNLDMLTTTEIQTALEAADLGGENKLELIGFDACIMSNIETAWCLKDYANYLVASQENEPGTGWDYSFLKNLEYYQDGKSLATEIIDTYYSTSLELYKSNAELTLACLDLSKIENTEACLNDLFADVNTYIKEDGFADLSKKRYNTKVFSKTTDGSAPDIVDLNHMATLLEDKYPEKAKALKDSISELICYSKTNVENASGVSVWYPYESATYMSDGIFTLFYINHLNNNNFDNCDKYIDYYWQVYDNYDFADNYTTYLGNFITKLNGGNPADTPYQNSEVSVGSDNMVYLTLTPEQYATLAGCQYVVYYKIPASESLSSKDEYIPVFSGKDFRVDENGYYYASYNASQIFVVDEGTGSDFGVPLSLNYYYDGSEELKYYTEAVFSRYSADEGSESKGVNWTINIDGENVEFGNAKPTRTDENDGMPQKELVNPDDYDTYQIFQKSYFLTTDEAGNNKLVSNDNIYYSEVSKKTGYHLEYREIEDLDNYYISLNITDIYGTEHITSFTCLAQ